MNKKAQIVTLVSLKTYIILMIIGAILIFGYIYVFIPYQVEKTLGGNEKNIACPSEIIPDRINCVLNQERCNLNIWGKNYWPDGTEVSGQLTYRKGSAKGENINYLYPTSTSALPRYERDNVAEDGTVLEGIRYSIYLVLDSRDKTNEGYKVIESKCKAPSNLNNYIPLEQINEPLDTNSQVTETEKENNDEPVVQDTPPEPTLEESCNLAFSSSGIFSITSTQKFEDYNSASSWIETKYPDEGLTINKARFFKEWYLDKAQFPVIIVEGSKKIDQSMTETGEYVCDSTGVLKR